MKAVDWTRESSDEILSAGMGAALSEMLWMKQWDSDLEYPPFESASSRIER
jgi:hypothetical protein